MHRKTQKMNSDKTGVKYFLLLFSILGAMSMCFTVARITDAQSDPDQAIAKIPPTLKPLNSPETFGPDNLYEKINGQAELYLSAGFVRLKSQWFSETEDAGAMFEVYIFHMGDVLNAFSVYGAQRGDDAQEIDLGQFAYQTKNSLFLVHGPYYVEMISATPSENMLPKMKSLAQNFVIDTRVDSKSIEGLELFPKENLDPGSISLIARDAFGLDGLDRVFTAAYTIGGNKVTAFISKRKTPQEAKDLLIGCHKYFLAFGGKDITSDLAIKDVKVIEMMDTFDIIFSFDSYLAGIHEASVKTEAESVAELLAKSLRKKHGAK
ncbi:DUF6599 family protein [Thermodesulfobacteriota bacterium]